MKKQNIIDAVIDFLKSDQSGENKAIAHEEIVKVHLNDVFNKIIYETYLNGKKFSDFSQLDAWSKIYECDIEAQVGTEAYVFLPFPPYQLPDNAGVREARAHSNPSNVFAPVEATSNPVFDELEVSTMDSTPTYHIEQNNVSVIVGEASHLLRLRQMPTGASAITSIDVLMIVGPEQLDDYDDMAIPAGQEDTIIRQIIDIMVRKPKPDTGNDMVIDNTPTA